MKHLCIAVLAHVDAGKTTLSEAMLYESGTIRKLGRVDNKDAFLDTHELERARGITIFSKQAEFTLGDWKVTLLDTPGHADFSAEMERTLQVLDYAVLVISGADGVQGHTRTLWRLLKRYGVPVFLFVNKMDQNGTDKELLMEHLKKELDDRCVDFDCDQTSGEFLENVAVCEEQALEHYLEHGTVSEQMIRELIRDRHVFPCYFGSALKLDRVDEFLRGLEKYSYVEEPEQEFGARIFKISRDEQGGRLTWLRVTGGTLKVKDTLTGTAEEEEWQEKVNQIRVYSGTKYETVNEAEAGMVCAVTGLTKTRAGEGLGIEHHTNLPVLEPVLNYKLTLPRDCDPVQLLGKLRLLEDEEPELHIRWNEKLREIEVQLMGEVQIEILKKLILDRFGVSVDFDEGNIVYKETIANTVEGVGHFEPLRHYAEVHLLMEPGEQGSGLQFAADCSEDLLDRNWQRLVLTHLEERQHKGVLTGSDITDMRITLVAGRAHQKHTEGGDFRQATYRAVRQGLMQAESVLLEPWYDFRLEVPSETLGHAMMDLERMGAEMGLPEQEGDMSVLAGGVAVACIKNYQKEINSYTKGRGRLTCIFRGYGRCHNPEEVLEETWYDPETDFRNPSSSVFCYHGAGTIVPWYEVPQHMHLESVLQKNGSLRASTIRENPLEDLNQPEERRRPAVMLGSAEEEEELQAIMQRTFGEEKLRRYNDHPASRTYGVEKPEKAKPYKPKEKLPEYFLVDGYNVIFAWEELSDLAKVSIAGAREKLQDIMCNYQGFRKCNLILVFDAYRVEGHEEEIVPYHNIHVVYTKEAETADSYIERTAHQIGRKYQVTVATSDGLEQIIIRGQGCAMMSARELKEEINRINQEIRRDYVEQFPGSKNYLFDYLPEDLQKHLQDVRMGNAEFGSHQKKQEE